MDRRACTTILFALITQFAFCGTTVTIPQKALDILQRNKAKIGRTKQLIIAYNDTLSSCHATLIALEKVHGKWNVKFEPVHGWMGRNGFALPCEKIEGDGKTPTGIFRLGQLFGYEETFDTKLPYSKTTTDDKWIDDPESDDYNKYIRGETTAKSFEKLLIRSDAYKYCLVIEYNTHPVVKGAGSAIFFHLGDEPTSGCITVSEEQMNPILMWLNPKMKPSVLMGNYDVLCKGL
jgi:L,D-peptidoglycan transpeptidase YkuD (ErfK/YbiS/YcfS/YnhG family)